MTKSSAQGSIGFGRQLSDRVSDAMATTWFMDSLLIASLLALASVIS